MRVSAEAEIVACIPLLRRYARGLLSNPVLADDLVQDTLERAWRRYSMWQRRGEIRAWLFGIMHNLFVDGLRQQRSRAEEALESESADATPHRAEQADRLEVRDLDRMLQRLAPELREVLLLVGVEELSYHDVAAVLGIPLGTVMSRLSRARARLRSEIDGHAPVGRIQRVK